MKKKIFYISFDFIRSDEECSKDVCYFNTALVFDKNGQIVSKYDKFNVYENPYIDTPLHPHPITFETDSGILIGLLICFDINYLHPAQDLFQRNVDVIIFQAAWVDELPFLTGLFSKKIFPYFLIIFIFKVNLL